MLLLNRRTSPRASRVTEAAPWAGMVGQPSLLREVLAQCPKVWVVLAERGIDRIMVVNPGQTRLAVRPRGGRRRTK